MTRTARGLALAGLLFAALAGWEASALERWAWDGPGPGLFPQVLALLIAAASLGVLLWPGEAAGPPEGGARPWANRTFQAYVGAMLGVALLLPLLGFILPMLLAALLMLRLGEGRGWGESLGYSLALVAGTVLLFGTALGVPFPSGLVEQALAGAGLLHGG